MAIVQLLLGTPQKGTRIDRTVANKTASLALDATVSENYNVPARVTQHPVENAVDITDHIVLSPRTLSINGVISETPFNVEGQGVGVVNTVAAQIGNQLTGNSLGGLSASLAASKTLAGVLKPRSVTNGVIPGDTTRLRDATTELLNLRNSKIPVTIVTGLQRYENFLLVSFTINRTNSTGGSIEVSLEFTEFVLANSQTVSIVVPKIKSAIQPSNQGRKNASPVEGETGRRASFLLQGLRGVGSALSGGGTP